jgi:hypothetical protein
MRASRRHAVGGSIVVDVLHVILAGGLCLVLVSVVHELLGPMRLPVDERGVGSRRHRLAAWIRGWPARPRPPVESIDWGKGGFLFLWSFFAFCFVVGGITQVAHPSGALSVVLGSLAAIFGFGLATLVVLYLRRPKRPKGV